MAIIRNGVGAIEIIFVRFFARLQYIYWLVSAGILSQSMGARNRVGIGLSYRAGLLGYIGWLNRFFGIDFWAT